MNHIYIVLGFCAFIFFGGLYGSALIGESVRNAQEARDVQNQKCIDAGGVPVAVQIYTKGLGKGNVCVKNAEKLEIQ